MNRRNAVNTSPNGCRLALGLRVLNSQNNMEPWVGTGAPSAQPIPPAHRSLFHPPSRLGSEPPEMLGGSATDPKNAAVPQRTDPMAVLEQGWTPGGGGSFWNDPICGAVGAGWAARSLVWMLFSHGGGHVGMILQRWFAGLL